MAPHANAARSAYRTARMNGEKVTSVSPLEPMPVWRWPVARWTTFDECAAALDLTPGELGWFADSRSWNRRAADKVRHYRYRWIRTATGGSACWNSRNHVSPSSSAASAGTCSTRSRCTRRLTGSAAAGRR